MGRGSRQGDTTTSQFWIEQDRLLFVRLIEAQASQGPTPRPASSTSRSRTTSGWRAWVAPKVVIKLNGKEVQREEYRDIRADCSCRPICTTPRPITRRTGSAGKRRGVPVGRLTPGPAQSLGSSIPITGLERPRLVHRCVLPAASGGRLMSTLSTAHSYASPNTVPRSWTRLNSTYRPRRASWNRRSRSPYGKIPAPVHDRPVRRLAGRAPRPSRTRAAARNRARCPPPEMIEEDPADPPTLVAPVGVHEIVVAPGLEAGIERGVVPVAQRLERTVKVPRVVGEGIVGVRSVPPPNQASSVSPPAPRSRSTAR